MQDGWVWASREGECTPGQPDRLSPLMPLVDSLLTAIVRSDGDALVLHVGEKPYVVAATGSVELSRQGLGARRDGRPARPVAVGRRAARPARDGRGRARARAQFCGWRRPLHGRGRSRRRRHLDRNPSPPQRAGAGVRGGTRAAGRGDRGPAHARQRGGRRAADRRRRRRGRRAGGGGPRAGGDRRRRRAGGAAARGRCGERRGAARGDAGGRIGSGACRGAPGRVRSRCARPRRISSRCLGSGVDVGVARARAPTRRAVRRRASALRRAGARRGACRARGGGRRDARSSRLASRGSSAGRPDARHRRVGDRARAGDRLRSAL